jgi:hypothetical protein
MPLSEPNGAARKNARQVNDRLFNTFFFDFISGS